MSNVTNTDPVVTESKLTEFYQDIKPFLGCPAYVTQEGDEQYYSTDEKVIGRWVDSKPIYQKKITFTALSLNPNSWTTICSASGLNIDSLINGRALGEGLNEVLCGGYRLYNGNIQMYSWVAFLIDAVVIQYTKTTDSAATTIETKPTHYSTDEQVVGYWIDNKPIYQKTISIGDLPAGNTEKPHGVANIDRVISHNVVATRNDGYQFYFPALHTNTAWNAYVHGVTATNIVFMIGANYTSNYQLHNCVATIQYTKSSD